MFAPRFRIIYRRTDQQIHSSLPPATDLEGAVNLAVRTTTMIDCSTQHQSLDLLEYGAYQVPWRSDVTFAKFVIDAFPTTDHPIINDDDFEP